MPSTALLSPPHLPLRAIRKSKLSGQDRPLPTFLPSFFLLPPTPLPLFPNGRKYNHAREDRGLFLDPFFTDGTVSGMQIGPRNALLSRFSFTESHPSCLFPYHFRKRTTSIHPFHSRPKEYPPSVGSKIRRFLIFLPAGR